MLFNMDWTKQREFSANFAFDKATNGQTDIKDDCGKHLPQCHF